MTRWRLRKAADMGSFTTSLPTVYGIVGKNGDGTYSFHLGSDATGGLFYRESGFATADEARDAALEYVRRNESRLLYQEGFSRKEEGAAMARKNAGVEWREEYDGSMWANVDGIQLSTGEDGGVVWWSVYDATVDKEIAGGFCEDIEEGKSLCEQRVSSRTAGLNLDAVVGQVNAGSDGMWDIKVDVRQSGDEYTVTLVDRNEFVSSYNCYEGFIRSSVFEPIENAVREQTGDPDFFFDCYDIITFIGTAIDGGFKFETGVWSEDAGAYHKHYTQDISAVVGQQSGGNWVWGVMNDFDEHIGDCDSADDGMAQADAYVSRVYGVTASRTASYDWIDSLTLDDFDTEPTRGEDTYVLERDGLHLIIECISYGMWWPWFWQEGGVTVKAEDDFDNPYDALEELQFLLEEVRYASKKAATDNAVSDGKARLGGKVAQSVTNDGNFAIGDMYEYWPGGPVFEITDIDGNDVFLECEGDPDFPLWTESGELMRELEDNGVIMASKKASYVDFSKIGTGWTVIDGSYYYQIDDRCIELYEVDGKWRIDAFDMDGYEANQMLFGEFPTESFDSPQEAADWCDAHINWIGDNSLPKIGARTAWVAKGDTWERFIEDFQDKSGLYAFDSGEPTSWLYSVDEDGNEYECEVTRYSEGDYELMDYNCRKLGGRHMASLDWKDDGVDEDYGDHWWFAYYEEYDLSVSLGEDMEGAWDAYQWKILDGDMNMIVAEGSESTLEGAEEAAEEALFGDVTEASRKTSGAFGPGTDKIDELCDLMGADAVLEALMRYLSEDELERAAESIATDWDYELMARRASRKEAISNDEYVNVIRDLTAQFPREQYHAEIADLNFRDTFDLGINWAGIGAVTTAEAREFASGIIEMADAIDALPYTVGEPVDWEASRKTAGGWENGVVTVNGNTYDFQAKVYDEPSIYGIDDGCISKLIVKRHEDSGWARPVLSYEREWDIEPQTDEQREILDKILDLYKEGARTASTSGRGTTPGGISYVAKVPTGFVDGSWFMEPADKYEFEDFVDAVGLDAAEISSYIKDHKLYNVFSEFDGRVLRDNGSQLVIQLNPEGSTLSLTKEGRRFRKASIGEDDLYFGDGIYRFDDGDIDGYIGNLGEGWEYYIYSYDKGEKAGSGFATKEDALDAVNSFLAESGDAESWYASRKTAHISLTQLKPLVPQYAQKAGIDQYVYGYIYDFLDWADEQSWVGLASRRTAPELDPWCFAYANEYIDDMNSQGVQVSADERTLALFAMWLLERGSVLASRKVALLGDDDLAMELAGQVRLLMSEFDESVDEAMSETKDWLDYQIWPMVKEYAELGMVRAMRKSAADRGDKLQALYQEYMSLYGSGLSREAADAIGDFLDWLYETGKRAKLASCKVAGYSRDLIEDFMDYANAKGITKSDETWNHTFFYGADKALQWADQQGRLASRKVALSDDDFATCVDDTYAGCKDFIDEGYDGYSEVQSEAYSYCQSWADEMGVALSSDEEDEIVQIVMDELEHEGVVS